MRAIWSCAFVAARKDRSIVTLLTTHYLTPLSALSRLDNRTSLMPPVCSGVVSRFEMVFRSGGAFPWASPFALLDAGFLV